MFKDSYNYVKVKNGQVNQFTIRPLKEEDINQVAIARIAQENENGNGATKEYIEEYKKGVLNLLNTNRLIGAGAFLGDNIVSIAFFNLISFGNDRRIPYLCGVWTNPTYRQNGLAMQVNKKLMQGVFERRDKLADNSLLTIEGNEAALRMYEKLGYKSVNGEMTFLGDVKDSGENVESYTSHIDKNCDELFFLKNGQKRMKISYSNEQFFPHPTNIDGKMTRITGIHPLQNDISANEFTKYMQEFFRSHRFCKLNMQELLAKEDDLGRIFGLPSNDSLGMVNAFNQMNFESNNGNILHIKPSNNVMEKDMVPDLDLLQSEYLDIEK